jgi:hypothetical protein
LQCQMKNVPGPMFEECPLAAALSLVSPHNILIQNGFHNIADKSVKRNPAILDPDRLRSSNTGFIRQLFTKNPRKAALATKSHLPTVRPRSRFRDFPSLIVIGIWSSAISATAFLIAIPRPMANISRP